MARRRLRRWLPSEEALRARKSLRWLGPLLERPWLWHLNRRSVAAGVAIGVFFGFLLPVFQIPFAALFSLLLRANLPVAAISTLVSNPITYAPIFMAAYRLGSVLLGEPASQAEVAALEAGAAEAEVLAAVWYQRISEVGKPLMLGLLVFAIAGSLSAYFATVLLWRLGLILRLRRRRLRPMQPGRW